MPDEEKRHERRPDSRTAQQAFMGWPADAGGKDIAIAVAHALSMVTRPTITPEPLHATTSQLERRLKANDHWTQRETADGDPPSCG